MKNSTRYWRTLTQSCTKPTSPHPKRTLSSSRPNVLPRLRKNSNKTDKPMMSTATHDTPYTSMLCSPTTNTPRKSCGARESKSGMSRRCSEPRRLAARNSTTSNSVEASSSNATTPEHWPNKLFHSKSSDLMQVFSFPTIDQCVEFITSRLGVAWNHDKEQMLTDKMYYKHLDTIVFYDPAEILDVPNSSYIFNQHLN